MHVFNIYLYIYVYMCVCVSGFLTVHLKHLQIHFGLIVLKLNAQGPLMMLIMLIRGCVFSLCNGEMLTYQRGFGVPKKPVLFTGCRRSDLLKLLHLFFFFKKTKIAFSLL